MSVRRGTLLEVVTPFVVVVVAATDATAVVANRKRVGCGERDTKHYLRLCRLAAMF